MATTEELEDGELYDDEITSSSITSSPAKIQPTNHEAETPGKEANKKSKSGNKRSVRHADHGKHADKKEEHSRRKKKRSEADAAIHEQANMMDYMAYRGYPPVASMYPSDPMLMAKRWSKHAISQPYDSPSPSEDERYAVERSNHKRRSLSDEEKIGARVEKVRGPYDSPSEEETQFGIELQRSSHKNKEERKNSHHSKDVDVDDREAYFRGENKEKRFLRGSRESKTSSNKLRRSRDGDTRRRMPERRKRGTEDTAAEDDEYSWDSRNDSDKRSSHVDYNEDFEKRGNKNQLYFEGHGRKKKLTETPMMDRPQCRFFMEGKCSKGDDCHFNHDFVPPRKPELCKFYVIGGCKKDACVYYHSDWPCKQFHETGICHSKEDCLFSHDQLTEETKILPFREALEDRINYCHMRKIFGKLDNINKNFEKPKDIPSLLELEVYPDEEEHHMNDYKSNYEDNLNYDECIGDKSSSNAQYDDDYGFNAPINDQNYNYKQYNQSYQNNQWPNQNTESTNFVSHNTTFMTNEICNVTSEYDNENIKDPIENTVDVMLNDLRTQSNTVNQKSLMPPISINFSLPPPNFSLNSQMQLPNFTPSCIPNIRPVSSLPLVIDNRFTNSLNFLANHNMPPPLYGQPLLALPVSTANLQGPHSLENIGLLGPPPTSVPGLLGPPPSNIPNFSLPPPFTHQIASNLNTLNNQNINHVEPPTNSLNSLISIPINQTSLTSINQILSPPQYDINQLMPIIKNTNINSFTFENSNFLSPSSIVKTNMIENNDIIEMYNEQSGKLENKNKTQDTYTKSKETFMDITHENSAIKSQNIGDIDKATKDEVSKNSKSTIDPRKKIEIKITSMVQPSPIISLSPPCSPEAIDHDESYLEVSVVGKKVEYVLYKIFVDRVPMLPEDITVCNPKDPRLKRYRMSHHINLEDDEKPINSAEGHKRSPRPYSLPDIVFLTTPAAPVLEDEQKKNKINKRLKLSCNEDIFKLNDSPLKSQPFPTPLTPDMWSSPPYKNENILLNNEKSVKKPIDYRNDPRYKKKKIRNIDNKELVTDSNNPPSLENTSKTGSKAIINRETEEITKIDKDTISGFYNSEFTTKYTIESEIHKPANKKNELNSKPLYEDYYSNLIIKSAFSSDPFEIDPVSDLGLDEASYEPQIDRQSSMEEIDFVAEDKSANILIKTNKSMKEMFMSIDPTTSPFC